MLTLLFAAALAFPIPASRPVPVTTPVLGPPPSRQYGLHVASDGSITLAVWNDERSGYDVAASRVNADGMPMDPTGILVQPGAWVEDVFWTGSSFAVVTLPIPPPQIAFAATAGVTTYSYTITYVGSDGTVTRAKPLAPADSMSYAARSADGPDAHLLFLPSSGLARFARVVDLQGRVIRQGTNGDGYAAVRPLAASNGSSFLVLRQDQGSVIAETLDLDGSWGGSIDPHLPEPFTPVALSHDGQGGYVLLGYDTIQNAFAVVRLDARGESVAPSAAIPSYGGDLYGLVGTVTASRGGFAAVWNLATSDGHTDGYVSRGGGLPEKRLHLYGTAYDTAYDPVNDLLFTAYDDKNTLTSTDVVVQKGSAPPVPLTFSANFQTKPAIAAGAHGFLAAWTENSGSGINIYVRRFAADATPLGEARVADTAPYPDDRYPDFQNASVTSSGDTYLVSWDRRLARRFDARNATWLDPVAFPLNAMAVASNSSGVLALTCEAKCPDFPCMMARRVAMSGSAAVSAGTILWGWDTQTRSALASDGTNYLAAWNDRLFPSPHLVAMRLRADGTPIDAAPIVLAPYRSDPVFSVAWNGKTYLVTWSQPDGISAAYIGSDGAVQQLGNVADFSYVGSLKAVAHDGTFVIFSQQWPPVVNATLLDGSTTTLDQQPAGFLDAASDGTHLMLTYARIDAEAGRVSRVFLDPRVFPSRKRAVR